jgi:2-oxoglutarate dehydrogenase E2 component (dihydrolipoamide succinyltransferase)
MAQVELVMPKMGESIMEATILNWVKKEGDSVEMDETILEIATDKVDSEVPSPVEGVIGKILFKENDTVAVGEVIAIIETEGAGAAPQPSPSVADQPADEKPASEPAPAASNGNGAPVQPATPAPQPATASVSISSGDRFYSPLVRSIAQEEGISQSELDQVPGSGKDGRVTKKDILAYVEQRQTAPQPQPQPQPQAPAAPAKPSMPAIDQPVVANGGAPGASGDTEIIEMDRMRRLIADHMVNSKHTSPHVTSFVEVDVTNIVNWRERHKRAFQEKFGEKITYTPIFIEAIVRAIHDFPMINVSVNGNQIIRKKNINIGMAAALPSGNLIVPVIKNADHLSLIGLTKSVNDLANRARQNKLKPEEIQDGTFTLTNVGTFGNVMGTPIINQPQVAIMAAGAIRKKPAVVETEFGDLIAVRQMMFLSLSYDHRVVDGFLGGSFLRRVGDYLEAFDANRPL